MHDIRPHFSLLHGAKDLAAAVVMCLIITTACTADTPRETEAVLTPAAVAESADTDSEKAPDKAAAKTKDDGEASANIPIVITSDTMVYDAMKQQIVFTKNVEAEDNRLHLKADKCVVDLTDTNEFKHINLSGNVEIVNEDSLAIGGRAEYRIKENIVILTETPVLYVGDGDGGGRMVITGAEWIEYDRAKNKFKVGGGTPRLTAVPGKKREPRPPTPEKE